MRFLQIFLSQCSLPMSDSQSTKNAQRLPHPIKLPYPSPVMSTVLVTSTSQDLFCTRVAKKSHLVGVREKQKHTEQENKMVARCCVFFPRNKTRCLRHQSATLFTLLASRSHKYLITPRCAISRQNRASFKV